jgi:hypothetical protein
MDDPAGREQRVPLSEPATALLHQWQASASTNSCSPRSTHARAGLCRTWHSPRCCGAWAKEASPSDGRELRHPEGNSPDARKKIGDPSCPRDMRANPCGEGFLPGQGRLQKHSRRRRRHRLAWMLVRNLRECRPRGNKTPETGLPGWETWIRTSTLPSVSPSLPEQERAIFVDVSGRSRGPAGSWPSAHWTICQVRKGCRFWATFTSST